MGRIATGTTTDAVVIAATNDEQRFLHIHPYAGSATELGHAIACAVIEATTQAITNERKRITNRG